MAEEDVDLRAEVAFHKMVLDRCITAAQVNHVPSEEAIRVIHLITGAEPIRIAVRRAQLFPEHP